MVERFPWSGRCRFESDRIERIFSICLIFAFNINNFCFDQPKPQSPAERSPANVNAFFYVWFVLFAGFNGRVWEKWISGTYICSIIMSIFHSHFLSIPSFLFCLKISNLCILKLNVKSWYLLYCRRLAPVPPTVVCEGIRE